MNTHYFLKLKNSFSLEVSGNDIKIKCDHPVTLSGEYYEKISISYTALLKTYSKIVRRNTLSMSKKQVAEGTRAATYIMLLKSVGFLLTNDLMEVFEMGI